MWRRASNLRIPRSATCVDVLGELLLRRSVIEASERFMCPVEVELARCEWEATCTRRCWRKGSDDRDMLPRIGSRWLATIRRGTTAVLGNESSQCWNGQPLQFLILRERNSGDILLYLRVDTSGTDWTPGVEAVRLSPRLGVPLDVVLSNAGFKSSMAGKVQPFHSIKYVD